MLALVNRLEPSGVATWIDHDGTRGTENDAQIISEAIKGVTVVLVLCSTAALPSRKVRQALSFGHHFEKPFLLLLLEPVTVPDEVTHWLKAAERVEVHDHPEKTWHSSVPMSLSQWDITW